MTEPIRDLAHLSHIELKTPKPDESLVYFREILGMEIAGEGRDSAYLRNVARAAPRHRLASPRQRRN